jgi:ATP-dependent protease ClpP protease subunit
MSYFSYKKGPRLAKKRKVEEEPEEEEEEEFDEEVVQAIQEGIQKQIMGKFHHNHDLHERIYFEDNHLYFHAPIDSESSFRFKRVLNNLTKKLLDMKTKFNIPAPVIKFHITSYGGDLFEGLAMVGVIETCPLEIHSIIEGSCASAATLVSISCDHRSIQKHSFMLLHQLSGSAVGRMSEILDEAENVKNITEVTNKIYIDRTKMTRKQLADLESHDFWLNSKECLKRGLVDEILESP